VDDSPGIENVILLVLVGTIVADGVPGSDDSEDSDSVVSENSSVLSDSVSHDAMGASLALGGNNILDAGNSSSEEFEISESCLSYFLKLFGCGSSGFFSHVTSIFMLPVLILRNFSAWGLMRCLELGGVPLNSILCGEDSSTDVSNECLCITSWACEEVA
jgi:hypothetical protein